MYQQKDLFLNLRGQFQTGIVHLLPLFVIVVLVLGVLGFVVFKDKLNINVPFLAQKPNISVQEEYSNPFNKESQYVNPFNEFKNPFVVNR